MSELTDRTMDMLKFNHRLTKKYWQGLKFGIGNCFAKLVFLVAEFDNEFVYLLERLLPKFNLEVSDVYITPFYKLKMRNETILTKIFHKEMSIVEPCYIVITDNIEPEMPELLPYERIVEFAEIMKMEKEPDYDKKELIKKQKYILGRLGEILKDL